MPLIVAFIFMLSNAHPARAGHGNHANVSMGESLDGVVEENVLNNETKGVRAFPPQTKTEMETRIIGGREAWPNSWPWQVSLRFATMHACGGAIVTDQWIITAAHCFIKYNKPAFWTAMAGKHDLHKSNEAFQQLRDVALILSHREYNRVTKENDIALVKLVDPFTLNVFLRPINILAGPLRLGMECTITGWGSTRENGPHVSKLQEVNVTILPIHTCNTFYHGKVQERMFCAGNEAGGVDACQGDSGGPLSCFRGRWYELAGVVSWGVGCGRAQKPGVYTKLQRYKGWMDTEIQSYEGYDYTGANRASDLVHCGRAIMPPGSLGNASAEVVDSDEDGPRVLNVSTAYPYSWPWQVSLQSDGVHYCSGTLISHDWVLAPKHCYCKKDWDVVALGVHDLTFMSTPPIPVAEVIDFQGGASFPPAFDLSLIRLDSPVRFDPTVSQVCIPHEDDDEPDESWSCMTTGWGSTDATRVNPDILHQARLNIVNKTACRAAWGDELILNTHLCASAAGSTACMGDSGGPLLCQRRGLYYLVGMATWSSTTCDPTKPAVFTRVSAFQSWIAEITDELN
ncbi:ovochymase-1 isoform X2 [Clupea harengus]|uniref:Ovochymase-1 isoform X2 n=1 Tax=Clupea harengus TaxID=7950 RepID=A0A6P8GHH8_CLUHA|nr:ovochymase-1 isoform X2 [Clupea harengus]